MNFSVKGNIVDIKSKNIYPGKVLIEDGKIKSIERLSAGQLLPNFILPGFIDAHVHIESSMLIPSEFARAAVVHGTVATISDPHEVANVMGIEGIEYMLDNAKKVPFHFYFGAPSCVPATSFETAGAIINATDIEKLMARKENVYLAEVMNYRGGINKDKELLKKLQAAKKHNKQIDGHAPGLMGDDMKKYFSAGISTDHECYLYDEALAKLQFGVNILIREGSAAKNFETLIPLLKVMPERIMFCSDDKHPDGLLAGHINLLVKRAIAKGHDLFDVLRASSFNVMKHYNLPVGMLRSGDSADFIVCDNLKDFKIKANIKTIRVIEAIDGQLITNEIHCKANKVNSFIESDVQNDVLKIVVVNRYDDVPPAIAFVKNIGLKNGAIASCVAHDCHNIVAVGTNDDDLCNAVNLIIKNKGGRSE